MRISISPFELPEQDIVAAQQLLVMPTFNEIYGNSQLSDYITPKRLGGSILRIVKSSNGEEHSDEFSVEQVGLSFNRKGELTSSSYGIVFEDFRPNRERYIEASSLIIGKFMRCPIPELRTNAIESTSRLINVAIESQMV